MTAKTIDQLPPVVSLDGSEQLPVQVGSSTKSATTSAISAMVTASAAFQSALAPLLAADSAAATALGGFISSTQSALTALSASVGANTTALNTANAAIATMQTQISVLNSKVLPSGASAPSFSAAPTMTGSLTVGSTLTFVTGTYSGTVTGSTYTLRRGSTIIQGPGTATTYVVQSADSLATLTLTQTLASAFPDVASTSIGYVIGTAPAVPVNTALPSISGSAAVGQTATLVRGTYSNSPTSYTQQWYRAGSAISGATATTYVYVSADAGLSVTVREIATNATGSSAPATSAAVSVSGGVAPAYDAASTLPGIQTGTYQVGQTLTGDVGAPSNNPDQTLYTYQWYRAGVSISGATSITYLLVTADGDKIVSFGVIPRNAAGAGAEERSAGIYITP